MNANTALDGHTTVIKMAERGGVPLNTIIYLLPLYGGSTCFHGVGLRTHCNPDLEPLKTAPNEPL